MKQLGGNTGKICAFYKKYVFDHECMYLGRKLEKYVFLAQTVKADNTGIKETWSKKT